jgi:hypothetical protein
MTGTPWHTESWFTSPWNHEPSVAGLEADENQRLEILQGVKAFSLEHKRLLTKDEFASIAAAVTGPGVTAG